MSYNHAFTRKAFKLATGDDLSSSNIIHRMLHPAQDLQLMESIQHDVGLAPGLALYFDDEHVLVYELAKADQLPAEHQSFYGKASEAGDWLGVTWELCLAPTEKDRQAEVITSGDQGYIEKLRTDLNASFRPVVDGLNVDGCDVEVIDSFGDLYAVTCRLAAKSHNEVMHILALDERAAVEAALRKLCVAAGVDPDPLSKNHPSCFVVSAKRIGTHQIAF